MKNILPPDTELQNIDASLKKGERQALWLGCAAVSLFLVFILLYNCEESIKKESPKLELQADFTEYTNA